MWVTPPKTGTARLFPLTLAVAGLLFLAAAPMLGQAQTFDPPMPRSGDHDVVPTCGDPNYLSKTGSQCGEPTSLITSDGLQSPQNIVRCHPIGGAAPCQPWYWCQQYARSMDIMFLLDASNSIGSKWKNLMKVVIAMVEELETQVYPLVKCDTSSKNADCDFRMAMQMWGFTNTNNRYHGNMQCNNNVKPIQCSTKTSTLCKKTGKTTALQLYYADDQIPEQNWVSQIFRNTDVGGDNYIEFIGSTGATTTTDMRSPQPPTRAKTAYVHGWANARDPAEWTKACSGYGSTCTPPSYPVDNQVAFYKWLANEWHDNFRPCMGATQWSKPFQDCLYTVRKENPMSSADDDAFRLCIMVTDGQPYNDGFDWKAVTKEVKTAGVQTVGVFLQTGRNYESDANHVYCISSCLDQSDYGKTLPGDDRYDFNVCYAYMSADASRAKNMRDACKFYIDGNVRTSNNIDAIKSKVSTLVSNIAAASYTVSTQTSRALECNFKNAPNEDLCEGGRCLQVNREAWVCFEGYEQGSSANGATTCTPCRPGHVRASWDGPAFCTVCGSGKFMPLEGGKTCSMCKTGQYSTSCVGQNDPGCACLSSAQPGCQGIPIGQCPHEGCVRCKNCPVGRFAGKLNEEGCSDSKGPPGCMASIGAQSPGTSCDACPVGWSGGPAGCEQCPEGFFSSAPGQTSCTQCAPGKFVNQMQQTACKACPHGKTAPNPGGTDCTPCGPGQRSVDPGVPGFGATDCTACAAGQVTPPADAYNTHSCVKCAVGKYRDTDDFDCKTCAAGSWTAVEATEGSCPLCPAGRYGDPITPAPCVLCDSGKKQASKGETSCVECSAGEYSVPTETTKGAHTCASCVRGKKSTAPKPTHICNSCPEGQYNGQTAQSACTPCSAGYFSEDRGQIACTSCAEKTESNMYQDAPGESGCKRCQVGKVANPANTECTNCAKGKFQNSNTGACQQCQGCGPGEYNPTGCSGSQGACEACEPGFYKSTDESALQNDESAFLQACTACADCPAGKFRPLDDACRQQQADSAPECTNCPLGRFNNQTSSEWDIFCSRCAPCGVGLERTNCGLSKPGSCTDWPTPVITSVTGPVGSSSGITNGGEQITISGENFVGPRGGELFFFLKEKVLPTTDDIVVRYGGPDSVPPTPYYYAKQCTIEPNCQLGAICDITCLTDEGVGRNLPIEVFIYQGAAADAVVGGVTCARCQSASFHTQSINYAAPLISEYEGTGADLIANTVGGEQLVIKGANFGPPCGPNCPWIMSAMLVEIDSNNNNAEDSGNGGGARRRLNTTNGSEKVYTMDHSSCVVFSHTRMRCNMPEGAGPAFKVVLNIAGQSSIETAMSYGRPVITSILDSRTSAQITELDTRGGQLITIIGKNLANTATELDQVLFGSAALGTQVFATISSSGVLSEPGTCQVKTASTAIECVTSPGVLRGHMWSIQVSGQMSDPSWPTNYKEPAVSSVFVADVVDRVNEAASLFKTEGGKAILSGTNLGVTAAGNQIFNVKTRVVLYPRGCCLDGGSGSIERPVDILKPEGGQDRLSFMMPSNYGAGWRLALRVSKTTVSASTPTTYSPWPPSTDVDSVQFGYQDPVIQHTKTNNAAGNRLRLTITGRNFCSDANCGTVYICNEGLLNESAILCFAGGDKRNGPAPGVVAMQEITAGSVVGTRTEWSHLSISITPQGNKTYDKRFIFVQVGSNALGSRSNPAYHSSTNPEIHAICKGTVNSCGDYESEIPLKYSANSFPTDGIDIGTGKSAELFLLVSEVDVSDASGLRVSLGFPSAPPQEQLIVSISEDTFDCKKEDGAVMIGGCSKISFRLPAAGWTGTDQSVTLWVATIRSNSATIDFDPPRVTHIFLAGSATPAEASLLTDGSELFDIVGANFGSSDIPNPFSLTFSENPPVTIYEQPGTGDPAADRLCLTYTHTKLSDCKLPAGQGRNYFLTMRVTDHAVVNFPENLQKLLSYIPPAITSVVPSRGPSHGRYEVTLSGTNMGVLMPEVHLGGHKIDVVPQANGYHQSFKVIVPPGQGENIELTVTTGGQLSAPVVFHYERPSVSQISPASSPTSGALRGASKRTVATITGSNFGVPNNTDVRVLFKTTKNKPNDPEVIFVAQGQDIISITNHSEISFLLPPGYGSEIRVFVSISGQVSETSLAFAYDTPRIDSISLDCSGYDDLLKDFVPNGRPCYGFRPAQFPETDNYATIQSISVSETGLSAVISYTQGADRASGALFQFAPEVGSSLDVLGMTGEAKMFNREWTVQNSSVATPGSQLKRSVVISLASQIEAIPGKTYAADGDSRSVPRVGLTYVSSTSQDFRLLETDGCGAQATPQNLRSSGLEPFERWQDRNDQAGASTGAVLLRECKQSSVDRRQRIVIRGSNFGKIAGAPVIVTMQAKSCDCSTRLDGTAVPCRHDTTRICAPKVDGGSCPADHTDCSTKSADVLPIRLLTVESHEEDRIIVPSVSGFGRYHELRISIGSVAAPTEILRYHRPTVTGWISEGSLTGEANTLRPDGASRLCYLGHNFGKGTPETMEPLIEVRIGSEYTVDGTKSDDLGITMPVCKDLKWIESLSSGSDEFKGTSAICCTVPEGTVGSRNHSIIINGQRDDCSTNAILCAFPENWPIDRKERELTKDDFSDLLRDSNSGSSPLFSCGRDSDVVASQSYGAVGELCLGVNAGVEHGRCKDSDCTYPKALAGFFRLDLDLQFACMAGSSKPCQKDVDVSDFEKDVLVGAGDGELCFAVLDDAASATGNGTIFCQESQHMCSNKGSDAVSPGKCVFRRPKEAKRALGNEYRFWSSSDDAAAVNALSPRCDSRRFEHLIDPSIYARFPGLRQSPTCYDIVACNPKSSCLGDNQCAPEYQWMKPKCEHWQELNPNRNNCTSDDQCRSRSGSTDGAFGLSSACSRNKPEDCARCNFDLGFGTDPVTGERQGVCECVGGAPRCGLCTQPVKYDEEGRDDVKGYFRLNNECQECPDNPVLILVGIVCVVIMGSVACWWLQSKKINISIITIGFDYFQVLAIFARINVKWPSWVKSLLQVLSILNFNIDIAGPECAFPEFDYRDKWIVTILFPLIFGGALLAVFLLVAAWKFIKSRFKLSSKKAKYTSHGPRLVATFLLIIYCLYLSVCRRALDIFNCNPPDPPDGYLYTEFVSIDCEAGICKCDDPNELQAELKPWAALALCFYAIGFPLFVAYITYFFRIQMKLDQLLRAHGLGESREDSIHGVDFESKKCGSKSKRTYIIRKTYNMLYYHFKPGKVYWMVIILTRKFLVALCALMFRANIGFMLSSILLILFFNYVLAAKHRPFMSTMERQLVLLAHREKAAEAEDFMKRGKSQDRIPKDAMLHFQLQDGIMKLQEEIRERQVNKKRGGGLASLDLAKGEGEKGTNARKKHYYFDYNTLDRVLISCAIFLSIIGLMFESKQFYITDLDTGLEVLNPASSAFYNTVLICAGLVLFGSIVYYAIVFLAEVVGNMPKWLLFCFASRESRHAKAAAMLAAYPSMTEGAIEMSVNPQLKGKIGIGASAAKADAEQAENDLDRLVGEVDKLDANQKALADEYRRLKAQGARAKLQKGVGNPRDRRRQKKTKQQFMPQHVNE